MLNRQVGSYRITEKLAEGGMGAVYLARHEIIERYAVVKVLHPRLSHDQDLVTRLLNEARAADSIQHPGIVKIHDVGYAEGQAYIIMERLEGETLASRIDRRLPTVRESIAIICELASALGAAHACNIIHRDLKPENIFLAVEAGAAAGERVKVLDFGVAKLAAQNRQEPGLTAEGAIFGTPAYMAPEQSSDAATVDHRADLYAIGCIFYELLCGQPPFGRGGLELLAAHLRDQPALPSSRVQAISEDLDQILTHLLAKNPDDRLQSCESLLRALHSADVAPRRIGTPVGAGEEDASASTQDHGELDADEAARGAVVASLPTTHSRTSGQLQQQEETGRRRKTGLIAALVLVALAAGAAGLVLGGKKARSTSVAIATEPVVHLEALVDAGSVVPAPEDELVAQIRAAIDQRDWQGAKLLADGAAPDDRSYSTIVELGKRAQVEDENRYTLKVLAGAAEDGKLAVMVYAYEQLPATSVYHPEATQVYEARRDAYLAQRFEQAQSHAAKRQCHQVHDIGHEIGTLFPEFADAAHALEEDCRTGRKPKPGPRPDASSSPATSQPSPADASVPAGPADASGASPADASVPAGPADASVPSPPAPLPPEGPPAGGQQSGSTPDGSPAAGAPSTPPPAPEPPAGDAGESAPGPAGPSPGKGPGSDTASLRAAVAAPELPDDIPPADLKNGVARIRASIEARCSKLLPQGGSGYISFTIQTSGRVGSGVQVSFGNEEFHECAWNAVRSASFPRANSETKLAIPLSIAAAKDTRGASQRKTRQPRPASPVSR